jgi:hypothetical protein
MWGKTQCLRSWTTSSGAANTPTSPHISPLPDLPHHPPRKLLIPLRVPLSDVGLGVAEDGLCRL